MRELDLLKHIYDQSAGIGGKVSIGPGDDMGMLSDIGGEVLVAVDQIVEGVHFDLASATLEQVGRKAMTRNLSDVAAMAGWPTGAVAGACLPQGFGEERTNQLFDAMRKTGEQYGCPLFGGDITIYDGPLILSVTVLARPGEWGAVKRTGAKPGDSIYVTGQLGGSLMTINNRTHHLDFEPRLTVARKLAETLGDELHCMIDLSDGLAKDLAHLCRAAKPSHQDALIDVDRLPVSKPGLLFAEQRGIAPWQAAVGDGEDYELCFCTSQTGAERLNEAGGTIEGVSLTRVGRMVEAGCKQATVSLKLSDGKMIEADNFGWEHGGSGG